MGARKKEKNDSATERSSLPDLATCLQFPWGLVKNKKNDSATERSSLPD